MAVHGLLQALIVNRKERRLLDLAREHGKPNRAKRAECDEIGEQGNRANPVWKCGKNDPIGIENAHAEYPRGDDHQLAWIALGGWIDEHQERNEELDSDH